ncbi:ABC transporter substrate-binding protein [Bosea sp. (in: a-proteobacteria)]|jgi:ABC-type branched-subunit amino acid transport system substrate-binding protein|uniref:ABC transporter substrate-binding protein n=1 Tax=Bosea sp. (in: a-proteobacteria) TaxID=1871050 RepID=UPI00273464D2|nr:ABC transporter substrate-binding protein [Bosea sp. (in: a-proteobacteria)]MDP3406756.1 ABC transporter substrate-binding protein [Bosea sp. (in: a-proteobacteria)]
MINRRDVLTGLACASTAALLPGRAFAETGVMADKIVLGQAAVFEGPASALGLGMRDGLTAAFAEANAKGGVGGRKIELLTQDDGYEPGKSIDATKALIAKDVFALVGPVGTPTAMAAHPIAKEAGLPFIGAFTGAEGLRDPYLPHVVNVRASYFQETEVWIERLVKDKGFTKIAIFYQDDAFGRAGLAGVKKAMDARKMSLVAEGTFERNTIAVRSALLEIRKANPEAVVMVGPYKPCAEFIKLCKQVKFTPVFMNISFVGSDALAAELGDAGAGVYVTQVVPLPTDASIPVVKAYQAALAASDAKDKKPGFVSLEGYLVGRTVLAALEKAGKAPTRKAVMEALTNGSFDFGGFKMTFGPNDNRGSDDVYLTVIGSDGTFKSVSSLSA